MEIFWDNFLAVEKTGPFEMFSFHLGKVKSKSVRQQNIEMWGRVDQEMATIIADKIGVEPLKSKQVSVNKKSAFISTEKTSNVAKTHIVDVVITYLIYCHEMD